MISVEPRWSHLPAPRSATRNACSDAITGLSQLFFVNAKGPTASTCSFNGYAVAANVLQPAKPLALNCWSRVKLGRSPEKVLPFRLTAIQVAPSGNILSCRGCGTLPG